MDIRQNLGVVLMGCFCALSVHAQEVDEEPLPQPSIVASAMRMNILYRGVDNPVELAVPGVPCEQLQVTITNGEISGSGCRYTIKPGSDGTTRLVVTWPTQTGQGSAKTLFRVREIPAPEVCLGASCVDYDSIPATMVRSAQGVIARMIDLGFDLKLDVIHYRLRVLRGYDATFDGTSNEARLSIEMSGALHDTRGGEMIIISDIRVKYPSGREVTQKPLHLYVE